MKIFLIHTTQGYYVFVIWKHIITISVCHYVTHFHEYGDKVNVVDTGNLLVNKYSRDPCPITQCIMINELDVELLFRSNGIPSKKTTQYPYKILSGAFNLRAFMTAFFKCFILAMFFKKLAEIIIINYKYLDTFA